MGRGISRLIHDFTKVGVPATSFEVHGDIVLLGLALFWQINSMCLR